MSELIDSITAFVYLAPKFLPAGGIASREAVWSVAVEHQGGGGANAS